MTVCVFLVVFFVCVCVLCSSLFSLVHVCVCACARDEVHSDVVHSIAPPPQPLHRSRKRKTEHAKTGIGYVRFGIPNGLAAGRQGGTVGDIYVVFVCAAAARVASTANPKPTRTKTRVCVCMCCSINARARTHQVHYLCEVSECAEWRCTPVGERATHTHTHTYRRVLHMRECGWCFYKYH